MPLQSGIYPSTTASFIIQNNSSIRRTIKVFGVKLNPGQILDLMRIPGVTEEDIRAELTKGSLKQLFAGGSLVVVSSSIIVSSGSSAHQQFLSGIGLSDRILRSLPIRLFGVALDGPVGTNPYVTPAAQSLTLPDNAKILVAGAGGAAIATPFMGMFARSGAGTIGPILIGTFALAGPVARSYCMSPSGDILFNSADAWTSIDVTYFPELQDVVSVVCPVTPGTGVVTLPAGLSGLVSILESEALTGGVVGKHQIMVPVANYFLSAALTTGQACLAAGKQGVSVCPADAVTNVRLKLGVIPKF